MARALPALAFLLAAFVSGGFHETVYSFLAAAFWLGLAVAVAVRTPPRPSAAVGALAALTALTLLSALWGQPGEALRVAPLPALYTAALYAAEWIGPRLLEPLRRAIVLAAAAGIVGRATGLAAPAPGPGSSRMAWPVTYANGLGLVCAFGVLLCVARRRPLGALVCAAALAWTFSRTAIAAALVGLVVLLLVTHRPRRRTALAAVVVLLAVAAAVAQPLAHAFAAPVPDTRDARRLVTVSGHGRTLLWHAAWREGVAHPFAGGGAGTWLRAAMASTGRLNLPANAHSLELETFAELGLLGVACLVVFFAAVYRRPRDATVLAVFTVWLLVAAVDWDWQLPAATLPAVLAAGTVTRTGRRFRALPVGVVGIVVGIACGLHMLGAIQLDHGRPTSLLPWDARPWVTLDPAKACRIDPQSPALALARVACPRRRAAGTPPP